MSGPASFDSAYAFLEEHADAADALGWTALELFGVHPVVGATRVGFCGALMLSGAPVTAVERDAITFARSCFRRRSSQPASVLVWEFSSIPKAHA